MDADFSVELGPPAEEAVLEFPWDSDVPGGPRYLDLRRHPELLAEVSEAAAHPALAAFLRAVNSPASPLETAKCDVWTDGDLGEAEEIYGGRTKLAAYIDLVFAVAPDRRDEAAAAPRFSFPHHERLAAALVGRLRRAPEIAAAIELIVRRCYYARPGAAAAVGFYLTAYVSGYGVDEADACRPWQQALAALADAILDLPAARD
jgi:hypothetical protein